MNYAEIEKILGYKFKSKNLLKTAFTHSSFSNENKTPSNERLEFLGDAVIEFIITERLYLEFKAREGDLSKLRSNIVSEKPLAEAIDRLGLEKFLLKGVGESKNTTKSTAVACDLFEAICGAIYLDGGIKEASKFFNFAVGELVENLKKHGFDDDPKTKLQEIFKHEKVSYNTVKTGEDHSPIYKTVVFVNGKKLGSGIGPTKKSAEENSASVAIMNLQNKLDKKL